VRAAGWSWGTIAAGFAADQPAKVDRLVLYDQPEMPKLGAYRTVARDAALQRWLNGVPVRAIA